jgi:CheY-like chemotaxis protein
VRQRTIVEKTINRCLLVDDNPAGVDARLARIPVIVLSSSALDVDVTRAAHLGAAGYIVKSIEFAEFRQALKAELSKHMMC